MGHQHRTQLYASICDSDLQTAAVTLLFYTGTQIKMENGQYWQEINNMHQTP